MFYWRLKVKKFFKLNHQITASELRVLGEDGKQLGILPLSEALKKAQELNLDLVELAPDAKPPVAKLIEFKKFKFQQEKKEKEARRHTKQVELKEVRVSPFIGDHDLQTALERIKKFIGDGDLVKISIVFTGRQMAHPEFGLKMLQKIMGNLGDTVEKEREGRFEGRRFVSMIRGIKGQTKPVEESKNETKNKKIGS
ncbi:translation initiation factor IF-3 [Candidatus Curtissbacteria bacterium RBG_13_40_7]|uniref:Translation initiation factor IF-3 n=1 Tax=Candidatus Curtissbacteria bacterium RBG_13_40_7 TaxID=1797706 RepID=A0A1F5FXY5_9BACT|nr:MAG: translation initiation factor IF-3 [Candidatus Curtissbacteria bacterium RBG_13_40_7]